jgi:hypothetical protein
MSEESVKYKIHFKILSFCHFDLIKWRIATKFHVLLYKEMNYNTLYNVIFSETTIIMIIMNMNEY